MTKPRWIDRRALLLLHTEGLREHGGPEGVRDAGLLESAQRTHSTDFGRPRKPRPRATPA